MSKLNDLCLAGASREEIIEAQGEEIESLRQQLSDHIKREVMLRDALKYSRHQCEGLRVWGGMSWSYHPFQAKRIFDACEEALAAATDLDGLILCKKKPTAWCQDVTYEMAPEFAFSWVETQIHDFPLYRAWEPKP